MTELEPIIPTLEFPEESDMLKFREKPADACEGMQRKYLGMTHDEFLPQWEALHDHEGEIPEGFELSDEVYENPFTHEKKVIKVLREKEKEPEPTPEEQIAEKIQELKLKLISWTITKEEKEMLKLLI